jgi:hypothetical protein
MASSTSLHRSPNRRDLRRRRPGLPGPHVDPILPPPAWILRARGGGLEQQQILRQQIFQQAREYAGVGIWISHDLHHALTDVRPCGGRIIVASFKGKGPPWHIVSCYTPQAGRPLAEKQAHYEMLGQIISQIPSAHPVYILGDYNARLGTPAEHEREFLGRWTWAPPGPAPPDPPQPQVADNRALLMQFVAAHDLIISNAPGQKQGDI